METERDIFVNGLMGLIRPYMRESIAEEFSVKPGQQPYEDEALLTLLRAMDAEKESALIDDCERITRKLLDKFWVMLETESSLMAPRIMIMSYLRKAHKAAQKASLKS